MSDSILDAPSEVEADVPKIAQKRHRILAFMIDIIVYSFIGMILGYFFGEPLESEVGFSLKGIPAFILLGLGVFFWPISEGVWGQTIGKRIFNLRVVSKDESPNTLPKAFVRFFFGFVDYFFFLGLLVAALNKKNQRIGDWIAGTIVIREKS